MERELKIKVSIHPSIVERSSVFKKTIMRSVSSPIELWDEKNEGKKVMQSKAVVNKPCAVPPPRPSSSSTCRRRLACCCCFSTPAQCSLSCATPLNNDRKFSFQITVHCLYCINVPSVDKSRNSLSFALRRSKVGRFSFSSHGKNTFDNKRVVVIR